MDVKSSLDKQGLRGPSDLPSGRFPEQTKWISRMGGSFVASPQGMSSRNRMEASETCGGSETIWHLQALFGKGGGEVVRGCARRWQPG